jgi:hypothetical protein
MIIQTDIPLLEDILQSSIEKLGSDFISYRNHCLRVFNFCTAFTEKNKIDKDKIAIAIAFHDLGIWTHNTFDYLKPSQTLAREYLIKTDRIAWINEIETMIANHHKIRKFPNDLAESFRKADWIDISLGSLKFGLPKSFVSETRSTFPNAGFHKKLTILTAQWTLKHPFNPLPMMKL